MPVNFLKSIAAGVKSVYGFACNVIGAFAGLIKYDEEQVRAAVTEPTVYVSRKVLDDFRKNVGRYTPETGGLLGSTGDETCVDICYFDRFSKNTPGTFYYDVPSMSEVFRTWKEKGSHNREIIVPMPDKGGYMVVNTVGTRQSSWFHSAKTGENSGYTERGRGLNEGITTMLTNRQLTEISPEKGKEAEQQQIYGHAVDLVSSLENIVGEGALKDAYYSGNMQGLESKVESLAGEKEFGHLRDCLDRSISDNYAERVAATREAQEILARMAERNKEL